MSHLPFLAIFWRSFFIQAFWNYPRMLGLGFLWALLPVARRLFPDREACIEFLKRHSCYFNSQPYCASLALGYILRKEDELTKSGSHGAQDRKAEILDTKDRLCGLLGLMGDQIFWQLLKPAAAAIAITTALLAAIAAGQFGALSAIIAAVAFLLLFNPLPIWMRWWGLQTGYRTGENLMAALSSGFIATLRNKLAQIGKYSALVLVVVGFTFVRQQLGEIGWLAFLLGFVAMFVMQKSRVPIHLALLTIILITLIPILLGWS